MPKLDLAALIVALVALGVSFMSLPTVFQMFCGRPKLRVEFEKSRLGDLTALRCHIWNDPIQSRFLRFIGVIRTPVDLSASFSIERTSGELVAPLVIPIISSERETSKQITLHQHGLPARIPIIVIKQNHAFVISEKEIALEPGGYLINLDFMLSNSNLHTYSEYLVIGETVDQSYWRGPE
jgi:hypothetical protein